LCQCHGKATPVHVLGPAGDDKLQFGALDHAVALRWRTVAVHDTPTAAAMHASSQTFLLLTEAADGICWLRLMSAATMQQVSAANRNCIVHRCVG
jgi:hypothetical protein